MTARWGMTERWGWLLAYGAGLLFGAGLIVGGMSQPAKVLAFLDIAGRWDPSLALVMGGGLAVAFPAFRALSKRLCGWDGTAKDIPTRRDVDARLIGGSALFGIGWGLVGLCPGPALLSLGFASLPGAVFVIVMVLAHGAGRRL